MDDDRFDALVRQLSVLTNRREGLRLLLAGLAAGGLGLATAFGGRVPKTFAKKGKNKTKNKKHKKKKAAPTCKSLASNCQQPAECCSRRCNEFGLCDCSQISERCNADSDCCAPNTRCGVTAGPCLGPGGAPRVCCLLEAPGCRDDCDCCFGFLCEGGRCTPEAACCPRGAFCLASGGRSVSAEGEGGDGDCQCCDGKVCAEVECDGSTQFRCCRESGACVNDCDCCGINRCVNGTCQPSECLPSEEICPDAHFEPCCPAGTSCAQPGCFTNQARTCPAGADSCATLVFCGEPNRLGCGCFLDLAGNSFCSLSISCTLECSSDADCADPLAPGRRCLRPCPSLCGHDRSVCSSVPCPEGV